jgi:superfamily II DNA or RNA helicase/HKD family nuclease/diadenosine tetraphosphate (Ap4A) HIT family hydrolase
MSHCPFCTAELSRIAFTEDGAIGLWESNPVSPGHLLIIPLRHAATWDDLLGPEKQAVWACIERGTTLITSQHSPDGFSVGFDLDEAPGQTVPHFHVHVIPRYSVDGRPSGGMRDVIEGSVQVHPAPSRAPVRRLIAGGDDHFLPHLVRQMDQAILCDIAVAFLMDSGARLIVEHLKDFLGRGGRARILVGDYMDVTEPSALRRFADLNGQLTFCIYETHNQGFHLKTYIFSSEKDGVAFVGSSNLSEAALTNSIEWNYKVISSLDQLAFPEISNEFESLFTSPNAAPVTSEWIDRYEARRNLLSVKEAGVAYEPPLRPPEPHDIQCRALNALERTRQDGFTAGLVVLATGLGKTWLAAFDSDRPAYKRILFVAHREEILDQAVETFRRVRTTARIGRLSANHKDMDADLMFASVQTLGKANIIKLFHPNKFDYIVIDEFHHAAASTYRKIIEYFDPKFLLGLTATPERSDGADLLALCQENLVFEAGLHAGIGGGHLSPFHYFGVPDHVDYRNIPWRNAKFDVLELTAAVATEARAENALEQLRMRGGAKCIGFCCSQSHADFMANFFNRRGLKAVAVHSGSTSAPRATSLQMLEAGKLDVMFAVDMFNEGVDVPSIDTVLMLRPTESTVIWLQQLGRGLRRSPGKDHLVVIDYIGNHRIFLTKLRAIASIAGLAASSNGHLRELLERLRGDQISLPAGCEVTYDLACIDILNALTRPTSSENALEDFYRDFRERHGTRPTAAETFHAGINPRSSSEHSWLGFVERIGDLQELELLSWSEHRALFSEIEKTEITKSYKLLVLFALFKDEIFQPSLSVDDIVENVARFASRIHRLELDLSVDLSDRKALKSLLLKYPIESLAGLRDSDGSPFFFVEEGRFGLVARPRASEAFGDLLRELLAWRLAQYLSRGGGALHSTDIICRVARNASGQPMLFLPPEEMRHLGEGPLDVAINGRQLRVIVAKIAINVVRDGVGPGNELPGILSGWFGDSVGLPGRADRVRLHFHREGWLMEPMGTPNLRQDGLRLWERYSRESIPVAFGLTFDQATWNAGFVPKLPHIFLLVTLEKEGMIDEHRYSDRFVSANEFSWQSQNRTIQTSKHGYMIREIVSLSVV